MVTKTKSRTKRARRAPRRNRRESRRERRMVEQPEHRERLHRAKRALRALRHHIFYPKAVIHTNKMHIPKALLEEIPEQALVEHWEAVGELKQRGIEVLATEVRNPRPHLTRIIELDAPVSVHARNFAQRHGLIIKERRSPIHTTLERLFG